ncbi:hypothetical protein [Barnesiella intestinihominis]|uniref:hypothetical protein n=1 Tax=Barnesiella intestinihominis TaxID=487174 RepID=UPI003AF90636
MSGCHVPCGWLSQQLQWGHEQRRQQRLRLVWFIQQYDERVQPERQFGQCELEQHQPHLRVHRPLRPSIYGTV